MSPQCGAITGSGRRCKQRIVLSDGLCAAHSPLSKAAPRPHAGSGVPALEKEAARYRARLEEVAEYAMRLGPDDSPKGAGVAVQALNGCLRALQVEHQLRDTRELEERLRRIEEAQRWGA